MSKNVETLLATARPAWRGTVSPEPRFSQSLERGLAILACFTAERPVQGIAELADQLGLARSTVHRYASTLLVLGYLEQDVSRKYRLGLRVTDLGFSALASMGLREHAYPFLVGLGRECGFSCGLGVLDGGEVLVVERVRGFRRGQYVVDEGLGVGGRLPVWCSALGKVLLAFAGEGVQRGLLGSLVLPRGVSKRGLRDELGLVVGRGLGVDDGGLGELVVGVAAPVRGEDGGVVAAVDVVGSRAVISADELAQSWGAALLAAASRISAKLGYRHAHQRT